MGSHTHMYGISLKTAILTFIKTAQVQHQREPLITQKRPTAAIDQDSTHMSRQSSAFEQHPRSQKQQNLRYFYFIIFTVNKSNCESANSQIRLNTQCRPDKKERLADGLS
jgi:hypothetical protein